MHSHKRAGEVEAAAGGLDADGVGIGFVDEELPFAGIQGVVEGEELLVAGETEFDGLSVGVEEGGDDGLGFGAVPFFEEKAQATLGALDGKVEVVRLVLDGDEPAEVPLVAGICSLVEASNFECWRRRP